MHARLHHINKSQNTFTDVNASASHINNSHVHNFGVMPFYNPAVVQPKLVIGASNNVYEKEADAMADNVVIKPSDVKATNNHEQNIVPGLNSLPPTHAVLQAQGNLIDAETRSFMESRLGHNFSNIKIHNNPSANQSAKDINALAYTYRNNIVFAKDKYQPQTIAGKKLLAHELAHTIQQENGTVSATSENGVVQRFASEEHQKLGDVATGKATYNLGTAADKFELTHGDILALSGDVFMPDELFKLAAKPGNKGQNKDTRDEIVWALQDLRIWEMRAEKKGTNPFAQQQDPRFQAGGIYVGYTFSDAVKAAVFEKYQKLGAANASHFVAPLGRTKSGAPVASSESSGSKYVKFHEDAITVADSAGRAGSTVDTGMAADAAAQHYLTDSFSAGHLRTPIASIREYWGNKYPLFWYNLQHKIALDTAIEMTKGTVITNHFAYTRILASVEAMATTLPAITLGDLIGSIYHDVDNESGLNVKGGGKVFGDKKLDAPTEKLAVDAIKASNNDVIKAFDHGKATPAPVPAKNLFNDVRVAGGGTKTKYAAELAIPEPDKKEPAQNWKAPDIGALWGQKFLGTKGDTVGDVISNRVKGGSIAIQLTALGDRFPADQDAVVATLYPRTAYMNGFVKKLQTDPKAGVLDIVNWIPHNTWTADTQSEVIQDLKTKGEAGDKKENLSALSPGQGFKFIQEYLDRGNPKHRWFLGWSEGDPAAYDMIITIFEGMNKVKRKELYKSVEGHAWNGNIKKNDKLAFKKLIAVKDDKKEVLDKPRIAKLKKIMNGK